MDIPQYQCIIYREGMEPGETLDPGPCNAMFLMGSPIPPAGTEIIVSRDDRAWRVLILSPPAKGECAAMVLEGPISKAEAGWGVVTTTAEPPRDGDGSTGDGAEQGQGSAGEAGARPETDADAPERGGSSSTAA